MLRANDIVVVPVEIICTGAGFIKASPMCGSNLAFAFTPRPWTTVQLVKKPTLRTIEQWSVQRYVVLSFDGFRRMLAPGLGIVGV